MTLNDADLRFLSELIVQAKLQDTSFAARVEDAMTKRLDQMNKRMERLMEQMDVMARAKSRVNDVTWYVCKQD
ncbi:MAG TPA: hypothetical protein VIJ87_08865, partial [Pyrinomonadaceae bacterium]